MNMDDNLLLKMVQNDVDTLRANNAKGEVAYTPNAWTRQGNVD